MDNNIGVFKIRSPVAGICSFIVGAVNVLLILYIIAIPAEQRFGPGNFYEFYAQNPLTYTLAWATISITGILCFAAILPAVNKKLNDYRNEWFQIASILATVGFAIMALKFLTLIGIAPQLTETYLSGDEIIKKVMVAQGLPQLDPHEWLAMACPGIWFITVNIIAFRKYAWNRIIAVFGLLIGIGYIFVVPASIFELELLDIVAAGIGAVSAPVWFIAMGILLLKRQQFGQTPSR